MLRSILGAFIGREMTRSGGRGGLGGGMLGAAAPLMLARMGPLGLVLGGAYVAKKVYDRRKGRAL